MNEDDEYNIFTVNSNVIVLYYDIDINAIHNRLYKQYYHAYYIYA